MILIEWMIRKRTWRSASVKCVLQPRSRQFSFGNTRSYHSVNLNPAIVSSHYLGVFVKNGEISTLRVKNRKNILKWGYFAVIRRSRLHPILSNLKLANETASNVNPFSPFHSHVPFSGQSTHAGIVPLYRVDST